MKKPLVIYHAGNSPYTFTEIPLHDIDGIELDLRMTKDRIVVVSHDRRIQQGDTRYSWIDTLSYKEINEAYGSEFPTFENCLAELSKYSESRHLTLDLDLKQGGMEKEIVELLKKYSITRVLISSPDVWTLSSFERLMPSVQIELTYHPNERWDLWDIRAFRYLTILIQFSLKPFLLRLIRRKTAKRDIDFASLSYRLVSPEVVSFFHDYSIKIVAWGNDSEKQLRRLVQLGVDGIKTKKPKLLEHIIESEKKRN